MLLTSITLALAHSRSRSLSHALSLCKSMFVRGLVVELFTHPHIHTLYHVQIPRCTLTLRLARPFPCLGHAWCLVDSSHVFPCLSTSLMSHLTLSRSISNSYLAPSLALALAHSPGKLSLSIARSISKSYLARHLAPSHSLISLLLSLSLTLPHFLRDSP